VEATNAEGDPFGYERLEALLEKGASKSSDELLADILAAVAAHVGSAELEDDRTLVLLTLT